MEFIRSQSRSKPLLVEVNSSNAYIRQNITSEIINGITFYNYDEAYLTIEEFNAYANKMLMNGQNVSENNQLTIMEAFADFYETVALNIQTEGGA